jgi:hypothetical protein
VTRLRKLVGPALVAVLPFAGPSCGTPGVAVDLTLPIDVAESALWIELGVYPDRCPPAAQLEGGVPEAGSLARLAYRRDEPAPALGKLPARKVGVAAIARSEDCGVVAAGCTTLDLSSERTIRVAMRTVEGAPGRCAAGSVCRYARCVPPVDPSDPSVGADCSLQLMGAGPLGNPLSVETQVGSPGIVATPEGFIVAYREYEPIGGVGRLTMYRVDSGGAALPARTETLADRCTDADETDGVGLALGGQGGLVTLARSACNLKTGYDLFSIDGSAQVTSYAVVVAPTAPLLQLSPAHPLAPAPNAAGSFLLALRIDGTSALQQITGGNKVSLLSTFGTAEDTGAWVASSANVVGVLAAGPPSGTPPTMDAGADAAKVDAGPPPDATLRLHLSAANGNLALLPSPFEFPGHWGSLAALGTRVVVVSDGEDLGRPVAFRAFDLGKKQVAVEDGLNPPTLGSALYADVALAGDRMFVATAQQGAISLQALDKATTTPILVRTVSFGDDPRIPSVKSVRDGRIAVAASTSRVAVAWASAKTLSANDAVGGYAVFACR